MTAIATTTTPSAAGGIRVSGKLIREPELRMQILGLATGRYVMTVRLRQEQGLPYVASMAIESRSTAMQAAHRKVNAMEIGQLVTVTGTHLDLTGTRDGAPALLVQGVTDITPQIPRHHSEAAQA